MAFSFKNSSSKTSFIITTFPSTGAITFSLWSTISLLGTLKNQKTNPYKINNGIRIINDQISRKYTAKKPNTATAMVATKMVPLLSLCSFIFMS